MQKRNLVFGSLVVVILTGAAAAGPGPNQEPRPPWKNVKVFSKNMDEEAMEKAMHSFNAQLGVTCIYCHTTDTINGVNVANFVSDALPAKRQAREMLRMTFKLNKKYFNVKLNGEMTTSPAVWCGTCHHGLLIPANKSPRQKR